MAFVITEPCIGVKDATCTEVCPVDCIRSGEAEQMYYIDPARCIDCGYCEAVCPVQAIFSEFNVPAKWWGYAHKNREFFNSVK
jgi:NAD-dependent dihydropyrimidine dehydrogenase PreA subunit